MAAQRTSFAKLERDRNKKAKAAAKRERRQDAAAGGQPAEAKAAPEVEIGGDGGVLSASDLLALIESLHKRRDDGTISYEEFEDKKVELLARLPIE